MSSVQIDQNKKRLYITLTGLLVGQEAKSISQQVIQAIDAFETEFDLITDISQCRPTAADGHLEIEKVQNYALEKGAKRFVRVVGERLLAQMQLERSGKQTGIKAICVASLEEAEQLLDHS
ncbi:MAG: hypothetical protein AB4058_16755 [Microcystaceae cyanobacterium]